MKDTAEKRKGKWFYILLAALAVYTIKNLFVGADVDEGYGIMAGYRLATGDRLLLEMWEPHQTSAIFTALFIRLFLWLTGGNNDFLNLYLKTVCFAGHALISLYAFRVLRECVPELAEDEATVLAMAFYVICPKNIFVPEYSNLHVCFFALLCFSMMRYYCAASPVKGKKRLLAEAGVFLACDVLAYPSMALLYPVCLIFIGRKAVHKPWKEYLIFSAPCIGGALLLTGYVLSYMTVSQILWVIPYILGEGSHQVTHGEKLYSCFTDIAKIIGVLAAVGLCALPLTLLSCKISEKKEKKADGTVRFMILCFLLLALFQIYCWLTSSYNAEYPQLYHMAVPLAGIYCHYRTGKKEKRGFYLIIFSFISYLAVVLLSNWGPMLLSPYLYMGSLGGLFCLMSYLKERDAKKGLLRRICTIFILCTVFGYCYVIIGGESANSSIFTARGLNRSGTRKGMITSYMTAYRYNTNREIWAEAVPDGSKVLYLGPSQFLYMMGECTVASPNTISTPTYDDSLLDYWELNPDRYPDTVVLETWFGENRLFEPDSFVMQWLENEFKASEVREYSYITVYYK